MANVIEVTGNNIYICTISDLEYPEIIQENRVLDGKYSFKSLSKGYLWYNVADTDFEKNYDLTYTLSTRVEGFLTGTYYSAETRNKEILRLVKLLLNKELEYLEDYHNIPILFYLHQKLNLEKPTEFKNELCDGKHKIFDVFNDEKFIGKVVVSDKFILNSGDQAGVTMPVSHSHSKNDDIIYNGFGNYIWTDDTEEEDLSQYYDDSYSKIQQITYFKHESVDDYKDEYDSNLIYIFHRRTYKLIKTIPKDEHFIKDRQSNGRYLDRGDCYVHNISQYGHLKCLEKKRLLEKIYQKYNIEPTFIKFETDAIRQQIRHSKMHSNCSCSSSLNLKNNSDNRPYSVFSSIGTNEHSCSIAILPYCSTNKFKKLVTDLFTFYLDGKGAHSIICIDFNVQLNFKKESNKIHRCDNELFINESNIINKTHYIKNCLNLYNTLLNYGFRMLHAFIKNAFVCIFTNSTNERKIKVEVLEPTSFEYVGNVYKNYPQQLKIITYY